MSAKRAEAIRPRPRYGRQVFERLSEISGLGAEFFDVRDDGAWIISEASADELNWTPACDLDGTSSPDPLSTPAIPFPFSGSQLAAWMLDGWGFFLGEAVGGFDPVARTHPNPSSLGLDTTALEGLGVRAVKVREALEEAHRSFAQAVARVGVPDSDDKVLEDQAHVAVVAATRAAKEAHNWSEHGITTEESESRRLAYLSAIRMHRDAHAVATSASNEAFRAWRKRMVRVLLAAELTVAPDSDEPGSERKLTEKQDRKIAEKHAARQSVTSLAREYGVSRRTIDASLVRSGRKAGPMKTKHAKTR